MMCWRPSQDLRSSSPDAQASFSASPCRPDASPPPPGTAAAPPAAAVLAPPPGSDQAQSSVPGLALLGLPDRRRGPCPASEQAGGAGGPVALSARCFSRSDSGA